MNQDIQQYWDTIGQAYQDNWQSPAKQWLSQQELDFITQSASPNVKTILDCGIGNGRIIENHLKNSPNAQIFGVDIAPSMVEFCRNKFSQNPNITLAQKPDEKLLPTSFPQEYDLITSIRVLKYNTNYLDMFAQLANMLTPGGRLVVTMPNSVSINALHHANITYKRTTLGRMRNLANQHQLRLQSVRGFSQLPDVLFDVKNNVFSQIIISSEKTLRNIFGPTFLKRILFYVFEKV